MHVGEPHVILVNLYQLPQIALGQASRSCSPTHRSNTRPIADQVPKRDRQEEHVEDEDIINIPRKKRRLRHDLITSRLSKPYATPSTYIANRQALRNGVWTRQKIPGRGLLRKAAILNLISMKRNTSAAAKTKQKDSPVNSNSTMSQSCKTPVSRASSCPRMLPQKVTRPIVPPEYAIFDHEDDSIDDQEQGIDGVYSDFNMLFSPEPEVEVYDQEYSFDSFDTGMYLNADLVGEKTMGLLMENERNEEVSVAPRVS